MGRTKNQIQKPATVHPLKSGKWAVFVTLVVPHELEAAKDARAYRAAPAKLNELRAEIAARAATLPNGAYG